MNQINISQKMTDDKKTLEILEEINKTLQEINRRQDSIELLSESNKLIDKVETRVEYSLNQIQNSFDRIHDKVFNFNNILIAAFMVLGTFPSDSPIIQLWTVIFPIIILMFLVYLDIRQMGIYRFAANEMEWTSTERDEYSKKLYIQTWLSLSAMGMSFGCLMYILINLFK